MTKKNKTTDNTVLKLDVDKFIYYTINNALNNDVYISFKDIAESSKEFWRKQWEKKTALMKRKIIQEFPRMKSKTEELRNKRITKFKHLYVWEMIAHKIYYFDLYRIVLLQKTFKKQNYEKFQKKCPYFIDYYIRFNCYFDFCRYLLPTRSRR